MLDLPGASRKNLEKSRFFCFFLERYRLDRNINYAFCIVGHQKNAVTTREIARYFYFEVTSKIWYESAIGKEEVRFEQ